MHARRIIIALLLISTIGFNYCYCQINQSSYPAMTRQFARVHGGKWIVPNQFIIKYADSLNYWDPGNPLPKFIFNPLFDIEQYRLFRYCDNEYLEKVWLTSMRKLVLNRVYNTNTLEAILNNNDSRLDQTLDKVLKSTQYVFYSCYSTRELVSMRLEELKEKEKNFNIKLNDIFH